MKDDNSVEHEPPLQELLDILREHSPDSAPVREYLEKHSEIEFFGDIQGVLDVKELIDVGLLR